jgi:hypothetical protein
MAGAGAMRLPPLLNYIGFFVWGITVPPLEVHSWALLIWVQPWPLQAFLPLQSFLAEAHEPCPLQLLAPTHLTWAEPALSSARAVIAPLTIRSAAAPATINDFAFISVLPLRLELHCLDVPAKPWFHSTKFLPAARRALKAAKKYFVAIMPTARISCNRNHSAASKYD